MRLRSSIDLLMEQSGIAALSQINQPLDASAYFFRAVGPAPTPNASESKKAHAEGSFGPRAVGGTNECSLEAP